MTNHKPNMATHLEIAQLRLDLIQNIIIEQFFRKCSDLDQSARNQELEAMSLMNSRYGREDGLDYARDLFVDSNFERKAIGIFEAIMNAIQKRINVIKYFIKKHTEIESRQTIPKTICIDCSSQNRHDTCGCCGRVICIGDNPKSAKMSVCDNCGKTVCSLCVLFKYRGKVRCIECYEDLLDYPEDWIPDEWLEDDDEFY